MTEELGQKPAFPTNYCIYDGEICEIQTGENTFKSLGMSKRFYAACAAMQGIISVGPNSNGQIGSINHIQNTIKFAYKYADEFLKQENL